MCVCVCVCVCIMNSSTLRFLSNISIFLLHVFQVHYLFYQKKIITKVE